MSAPHAGVCALALAHLALTPPVLAQEPPAALPADTQPTAQVVPTLQRVPVLDVSLGLRVFGRHLEYTDDIFGDFRAYDLWAAPAFQFHVLVTPGSWRVGARVWLTLGAELERTLAFALASRDRAGVTYDTHASELRAGLYAALHFTGAELSLALSYGDQQFVIASGSGATVHIPGVDSQYLRAGTSLRWQAHPKFAVQFGAGILGVLDGGPIQADYFPRASIGGADLSLGAAVGLGAGFELRASVDGRRYFYAMNSQPGDTWVAGGALDQYLSGTLSLAARR